MGYIDVRQLAALAEPMRKNGYGQYLLQLIDEEKGEGIGTETVPILS